MKRVQLPLDKEFSSSLMAGEELLLSGPVFTARDATHVRILEEYEQNGELPFGLSGQIIMYAGPTPARGDRALGSVGPTTSKRMDAATPIFLRAGLAGTFGKGDRGQEVVDAVRETGAVYLGAIGGIAALLAKHVVSSEVIAYPELGPEALIKLELKDFPAFVALDAQGTNFYAEGPKAWRKSMQSEERSSSTLEEEASHCSADSDKEAPHCSKVADKPTRGVFITFEGGEGAGKSTQITALARQLEMQGEQVLVLREPGDTKLGEGIRDLLLHGTDGSVSPLAELLLYEAARAQLVEEHIEPALRNRVTVICDRFFDSTTAYQGFGRGLDLEMIKTLNVIATKGICPDRTILLQTGAGEGLERANRVSAPDRLEREGLDFHERVAEGFASIAQCELERVRIVNSGAPIVEVFEEVLQNLSDLFPHLVLIAGD